MPIAARALIRTPALLLVAGLALGTSTPATAAPPPDRLRSHGTVVAAHAPRLPRVLASSWVLADAGTGEVLAAKDAHGRYLPASTIKVLTALTLLDKLDPDAMVTATAADAAVDGTRVGLVPGHRYPVSMLVKSMLVASGNDAANALGRAFGGVGKTAKYMTARARSMGAGDTVAGNTSGLDAHGQRSSAFDLAVFGRALLKSRRLSSYVSARSVVVSAAGLPSYPAKNHNPLLGHYAGALGVKNGYTVAANATYIGAARRHGRTLVVTMMDAHPRFWPSAMRLLDWGFAHAGHVTPVGTLDAPAVKAPARPAARKQAAAPPAPVATATARVTSAPAAAPSAVATVPRVALASAPARLAPQPWGATAVLLLVVSGWSLLRRAVSRAPVSTGRHRYSAPSRSER